MLTLMLPRTSLGPRQKINWEHVLTEALHCPVSSVQCCKLSSLWAGYGSVTELTATCEPVTDGQSNQQRLIAKQVEPPKGSGTAVHCTWIKRVKRQL